jgi:hypothetical protein
MNSDPYTPFALENFSGNKEKRTQQNTVVYFMQLNVILHTAKLYLTALEGVTSLLMRYGLWCYNVIII